MTTAMELSSLSLDELEARAETHQWRAELADMVAILGEINRRRDAQAATPAW